MPICHLRLDDGSTNRAVGVKWALPTASTAATLRLYFHAGHNAGETFVITPSVWCVPLNDTQLYYTTTASQFTALADVTITATAAAGWHRIVDIPLTFASCPAGGILATRLLLDNTKSTATTGAISIWAARLTSN
jgi:hypothetical protein